MLTSLSVVHADNDFDGTIIHGFDDRELVLAFVTRTALDDYFGWPWSLPDQGPPAPKERPSLKECRLLVDRNLSALEPIIQEKYRRGEYSILNRYGSSRKFIEITYADIPRGKVELTDSVIRMSRAARFMPA